MDPTLVPMLVLVPRRLLVLLMLLLLRLPKRKLFVLSATGSAETAIASALASVTISNAADLRGRGRHTWLWRRSGFLFTDLRGIHEKIVA